MYKVEKQLFQTNDFFGKDFCRINHCPTWITVMEVLFTRDLSSKWHYQPFEQQASDKQPTSYVQWIIDIWKVNWIGIYPRIELYNYKYVRGSCCGKVDNTTCIHKIKHSLVDKYCRENKITLSAGQ